MLGTILSALNVLIHLILTTLWEVLLAFSFSDEEAEIKKLPLGYTKKDVVDAALFINHCDVTMDTTEAAEILPLSHRFKLTCILPLPFPRGLCVSAVQLSAQKQPTALY